MVEDENDSDWDDDWGDTGTTNNKPPTQPQTTSSDYSNAVLPQTPDDAISITSSNLYNVQKKGSKILFSKAADSYIMAISTIDVPENEKLYIFQSEQGCYWKQIDSPYTVTIASPKKETKLKGKIHDNLFFF